MTPLDFKLISPLLVCSFFHIGNEMAVSIVQGLTVLTAVGDFPTRLFCYIGLEVG